MNHFQTQLARYPRFDFDTETFPISPGCQAPRVVTGQWKVSAPLVGTSLVQWAHGNPALGEFDAIVEGALRGSLVSGHNLPYDLACIAASYDDLLPLVFQCLEDDRAICTQVAARLADIALGKLTKDTTQYGLKPSVLRFAPESGIVLDKDDPWRTSYGTLWDTQPADFPAEAVHYLCLDAEAQHALTEGLIRFEAQIFPGVFEDLFRQTRKAFWHHLISCWGSRTEAAAVERYHAQVQADWKRDRDRCIAEGLVRRDGSADTKIARAFAAEAWARRMLAFPGAEQAVDALIKAAGKWRQGAKDKEVTPLLAPALGELPEGCPQPVPTDTGNLSLGDDACTQLADPLLLAYQNYNSLDTLMGKIEKLWAGTKVAIQPRFTTPQATGRSSCTEGGAKKGKPDTQPLSYGFQMQNPPAGCNPCGGSGEVEGRPCELCQGGAIGVRQCFVARQDVYLPSINYRGDTVLCSVDYDGFELKCWAQACIWAPGVGYSRLAEALNGTIEVNGKHVDRDPHTELAARLARIEVLEAYALRAKKDKAAEAWDIRYRQPSKAGNFMFPGGGGAERFASTIREQTGQDFPLFDLPDGTVGAYTLKAAWKQQWTEQKEYFEWINRIGDGNAIVAFAPPGHPAGMIRGGTIYTERSNFPFQNLGASAAGAAGWALARECYLPDGGPRGTRSPLYGSRIWGFLHDEFVVEMPLDRAAEAGARQAEVQIEQAKIWLPDLKVTAAPALMYRWAKKAKTVYREGRLVPWDTALARAA